jgi:hypothetical protein
VLGYGNIIIDNIKRLHFNLGHHFSLLEWEIFKREGINEIDEFGIVFGLFEQVNVEVLKLLVVDKYPVSF